MLRRCSLSTVFAAALMCLSSACHADEAGPAREAGERPELGLMGTIPIYWGEAGDFGEVVAGGSVTHWARPRLESGYRLRPIDTLDGESLAGLDFLMLAQPRALSPAENVALDDWVRKGGRLLLFADPMMTGESRFAIGDRRRPQDVILLSPILAHWGLELEFDDAVDADYVIASPSGMAIPVRLPGAFVDRDGDAACTIDAEVLAECLIGRGRAVILADAALLDLHDAHPGAPAALERLVAASFDHE